LWADDLHRVAERLKLARPAERAGAGFDHDRATLDLRDNVEKLIAHHPPLQHDAAMMIDPVKLKHVLGDIDTERLDGHCSSPSCCRLSA
jgi:hypothetical protein